MPRTSSRPLLAGRCPLRRRTSFTSSRLVALLSGLTAITVIAATMMMLAGCGIPVVVTAASPTVASTSTYDDLGHLKDCGHIVRGLGGTTPARPQDLSACLLNAFNICRRAKLEYDESGTDWKDDHIIGVTPTATPSAGACQITDDSTFFLYSTSAGGQQPPMHFTCGGIALQDGHVVVRDCGTEGDIILP